ncbi:hypothetical protein BGZ76_009925 [Entomortierella beljakovae]|nr:hypothetical protein BGZ76_009925 [Entomortierella beljakovae]
MTLSPKVQKFRSPVDGSNISITINPIDNSILWKHILRSFGDVSRVRVNDIDLHFMMNDEFEDLQPLRIEAYPKSTMEVILSKKHDTADLPPIYSEGHRHAEKICSVVLPFKSHTGKSADGYIRFGCRISLRHVVTGGYLHSVDWKYKTGSTQHAVLVSRSCEPSLEDFWQVVPACGNTNAADINLATGDMIRYGARVRLINVANKRWLHSHDKKSPVSGQHEVSTFGSITCSNYDDVWIVVRLENGTEYWKDSDLFLLRHETSDYYLHSHMISYMGENEATCNIPHHEIDNLWRARFA